MIASKRKRNKSARSAWIKEGYRSKFKTRMVSEEISETNRKYKDREKGDKLLRTKKPNCKPKHSGQRDEIRKSQMEQNRENIPEEMYVPQKPIISMYPNPISKSIPKLPERVIQNDRQTDLDLDLEINRDIEENSPYQEGIN